MTLRPVRTTVLAAALSALVTPLLATAASTADAGTADPVVVRVRDLDRGPRAEVHWRGGNVVHTAGGRKVTLPWTSRAARRAHLELVGATTAGWLVTTFDGGDTTDVWLVKAGRRTHVSDSSVFEGLVLSHGVSDDGSLFYTQTWDEVDDDVIDIEDLAGDEVAGGLFSGDPEVLSFSGPEAVIGTEDTQHLDVATDTVTPLGVDAAGASIVHDLLFVTDEGGLAGPTSLSDPAAPTWTADMTSIRVSPDATRVLSSPASDDDVIEVRDLATGELERSFDVRWLASTPVWETSRSIVFVGYAGGLAEKAALVRCRLSGRCARVSPILLEDDLGLPRQRESVG